MSFGRSFGATTSRAARRRSISACTVERLNGNASSSTSVSVFFALAAASRTASTAARTSAPIGATTYSRFTSTAWRASEARHISSIGASFAAAMTTAASPPAQPVGASPPSAAPSAPPSPPPGASSSSSSGAAASGSGPPPSAASRKRSSSTAEVSIGRMLASAGAAISVITGCAACASRTASEFPRAT